MKLPIVIVLLLILQSCNFGGAGTWMNKSIPEKEKAEIKILNGKLFHSIFNSDVSGVKSVMSEDLIKVGGTEIDKIVSQVAQLGRPTKYRLVDEFYVRNTKAGLHNTLSSGFSQPYDYIISYDGVTEDEYFSLIIPDQPTNEILIFAAYGKFKNEWKLNTLRVGQYSIGGKIASDYFELAQASYNKSYLIDAYLKVKLAITCLKPADRYLKYQRADEIIQFHDKVVDEINKKWKMPFALDDVPSRPEVFQISPVVTASNDYPMVYYLTKINLSDTVALRNEFNKIVPTVEHIFQGIDKENEEVYYRAFNDMPDGKKIVQYFTYTQISKKNSKMKQK